MKELLLPAVNLLPGIAIIILLGYFYSKTKLTGLIWMLVAYIIITLITVVSIYGTWYSYSRGISAIEMQKIYQIVGVVSLAAHIVFAIALGVVLSSFPNKKNPKDTLFP